VRRLQVLGDDSDATIGRLLRWERVRAGLTQKQLAHKAGVDEVTVNHIENDKRKRRPHPSTIHKLAEALGIPVERLLPLNPPSRGYS
jgi:transcriptional regulator with XRE-family HTH domain